MFKELSNKELRKSMYLLLDRLQTDLYDLPNIRDEYLQQILIRCRSYKEFSLIQKNLFTEDQEEYGKWEKVYRAFADYEIELIDIFNEEYADVFGSEE